MHDVTYIVLSGVRRDHDHGHAEARFAILTVLVISLGHVGVGDDGQDIVGRDGRYGGHVVVKAAVFVKVDDQHGFVPFGTAHQRSDDVVHELVAEHDVLGTFHGLDGTVVVQKAEGWEVSLSDVRGECVGEVAEFACWEAVGDVWEEAESGSRGRVT